MRDIWLNFLSDSIDRTLPFRNLARAVSHSVHRTSRSTAELAKEIAACGFSVEKQGTEAIERRHRTQGGRRVLRGLRDYQLRIGGITFFALREGGWTNGSCNSNVQWQYEGLDAIGEHTGDDHDRNIMVPFGGKPSGLEGPGRNRLPTKALSGLRRINLEGLRWRVFDAKGQVLGRLASQIATVIQGKDKPTYTPYREDGDMCIVLNAKDLCVTGRKLTNKFYRWHTGYVGHLKERSLKDQMVKDPTEVIRKAVLRMLPRNKLRDDRDRKLRIFTSGEHPFGDRPLEPYEMPPRQVREMRPRARRALIRAQKKAEQSRMTATPMSSNKEDNRA
ncbi:hypothetical protein M5K25_000417 [Dendrobium thyrsiflorum]|uniref:50S ribosomal protein L13 n=1 Tax=Dendrobium thyrsiflorum TaxID=117978 RepID=A0ABD0VTY2_DENTH